MGLPACPSLVCPNSSWSSGEGKLGEFPKNVYSPRSHRGQGTGEGSLSGRGTEYGHLRGAPKMGAGAWGDFPQELQQLRSSCLTKPNLPDRVSRGRHLPRTNPRELRGEAGTRSPDKCLVQAEGPTASFQGCLVGNGDQLLRTFEPQEPSLPPQGSIGGC